VNGRSCAMTFHFAYGSNMSRALMGARCPGATALGVATLSGWRFVINPDGVGSIAPHPGALLRGVLWCVTLRDLVALNAYESVDTALYLRRVLPVQLNARRLPALVYVARRLGTGRARPGYIKRWSPSGWRGARAKDTGEVG
jgi:gamma-glutamyl AIG2-like cyclotransferase